MTDPTVQGHPEIELVNDAGDVVSMITVCAECGEMRTILFLSRDRWYCSKCRIQGDARPQMFPVK